MPSEAVTLLPTNFASESATPVALPSTLLPPPSGCPSVTLRSLSLNSWDSCSSIASTLSKEKLNSWDSCSSIASTLSKEKLNSWDSCSSIASTLSKEKLNSWDSCSSIASILSKEKLNSWDSCSSIASTLSKEKLNSWDSCSSIASALSKEENGLSFRRSDDDDDDEQGAKYKDNEECAAIPSAGGNSVCDNDKLFPNTSSGIIADYTASEGENNVDDDGSDFDSESDFDSHSDFDSDSSTSGSISDGEIQSIACDDAMEQSADEDIEVQVQSLCRPVTHTLTPPLLTVDGFPGINESSSSYGSKLELTLLTLPLAEDDPSTSDTHPPAPSPPTTTEAERKWKEYIANRSTTPEYFLFPQFTPEQEEWIVGVNHPFKEYVLQTWQNKVHTSMHCWLEDLVN